MAGELSNWISTTKIDSLLCRDLGHNWEPYTAKQVGKGYERVLYCHTCGALKSQSLDKTGLILSTRISYPDGYLLPKGLPRMTREDKGLVRIATILKGADSNE